MPTLNWIGKDKVIHHLEDVPFRVLEHRYTYGAADSGNMIIRGDNLHALKSLLPRYEGRIKCIYIDPPYNTGNEGWVYNDNVNDPKIKKWLGEAVGREGEDLSRHDKWLCMMYPRLRLLQRLLADDGAIFISIDDNEQAFLKLICDEIFGYPNFVAQIVWQRTFATKNDSKFFSSEHEYIFVYSKNIDSLQIKSLPRGARQDERYSNPDNDPRGLWISTDLLRMEHRNNSVYGITTPSGKVFTPIPGTSWRHPENEMLALIANNEVWFGKNGNAKPRRKRFLSGVKQGINPQTIWKHDEVGHTQEAKQLLKKILDASTDFFTTPKTTRLLERIIQIVAEPDSIILDSFAGSGTTAHAVLKMNKADGGNRKFILVEMMDYAENITAERVRRVIDGYADVEGTGGGFEFHEIGEPLMFADCNLNEAVDAAKIRDYVWYMETKLPARAAEPSNPYFLGEANGAAYYFHYEKGRVTALNMEFLEAISVRAGRYIIYADICALSDETLKQCGITFKKIPRDISRL